MPPRHTPESFWERAPRLDPGICWEWKYASGPTGYGSVAYQGKMWRVHRLAWTLAVGPIPNGLLVLHHCDNRLCYNYERCLFLGTNSDNMADMLTKGRQNFQPSHGDRNGMRLHPERVARGERHGSRTHPESVLRGERNGYARLTEAQVIEARARYAAGGVSFPELGREFGVYWATMRMAVRGESWAWLPGAVPR